MTTSCIASGDAVIAPLVNIGGYAGELRTLFDQIKEAVATSVDRVGPETNTELTRLVEEEVPEALEFIEGSVQKLERQIHAILQLSRLGRHRGAFRLNPAK